MHRRGFLAALVALAGCASGPEPDTSEESAPRTTPSTASTAPDGADSPPTVVPTTADPEVAVDETLELGEWHTEGDWSYTITGVEKRTEYRVSFPGTPEAPTDMPDGSALLVASLRAKNLARSSQYEPMLSPGFVVDDDLAHAVGSIEVPGREERLDLDWLALADERERFSGSSIDPIDSGAIKNWWFAAVVDRDTDTSDVVATHEFSTLGTPSVAVGWQ